jgi:ectoine hydroxylase
MRLSKEQLEQFDREGYLFFPSLFTPQEIATLNAAVPELYSRREAYNVRERGSDAVRTNFAAHMYSEPFARLGRHPRMIEPVEDLFGEQLYMHQFKINGKMAFEGDVWQWHQDYGTWMNDDLMPTERAMNVAIFLDDVNEFNGPLMFIPGSHKKGVIDAKHDLTTTSYPLWTVDNDLITQLVARAGGKNGGIVSPKGPAGSMILFHSCLVHASTSNLSPWNRVSVYLSLCAVSNHIRRHKRPEYIAHRDFSPDRVPARRLPAEGLSGGRCPGSTGCLPARCRPPTFLSPMRSRPHESVRQASAACRSGQTGPSRPDRRRQVRFDVSRPGAPHPRRASGRHRRSFARRGARQPGPGRLAGRTHSGGVAGRRHQGGHDPRRR